MTDRSPTPAQAAAKPLLPCPFCGTSEMLRIVGANPGDGWGFVRCDYCDAEGPDPDVFPGGWNTRAAPAPAEQDPVAEAELEEAWKSGFNAGFGEAMLTKGAHPAPAPAVPDDVAGLIADCRQSAEVLRDGKSFLTCQGILRQAAETLEALTAEIARLEKSRFDVVTERNDLHVRAEAAEAEVARLTAELARLKAAADTLVNHPGWGTVNYTDGDMWADADKLRAILDAHTAAQPAPDAPCPCICHRQPGIMHIAPCCDQSPYGTGDLLEDAALHAMRHPQPAPDAVAEADAWRDVLVERQRQISAEGWTPDHDDCHDRSELAQAAACYALSGTPADEAVFIHGRWKDPRDLFWPWSWDRSWWKPTDRRRDLVKAGALILAEIERLDRAAKGPSA